MSLARYQISAVDEFGDHTSTEEMRCHCVQALWAPTPPQHDVVAMVALDNPPSIWTGGSRGDIIYWKLPCRPPDEDSGEELWPMAILCGHAAAIAGLAACKLHEVKNSGVDSNGDKDLYHQRGASDASVIIMSVCVEGWLCAWDSLTGRCRRRRRLPPWVGSPCMMTTLPKTERYVAIACDGANTGLTRNSSIDDGDNEIRRLVDNARTLALEKSGNIKKNMRGSIIIVDSSTLGILQVVHNGFLGMGQIKSIMAVAEGDKMHKLMLSDLLGQIRSWVVHGKQDCARSEKSVRSEQSELTTLSYHKSDETAQTVSFSPDGEHMLLVFTSYWVIQSTKDQSIVQESVHQAVTSSGPGNLSWVGGFFFIDPNIAVDSTHFKEVEGHNYMFLVWDTVGGAMLYSLENKPNQIFATKDICRIPPVALNCDIHCSIKFCQLRDLVICIGYNKSRLRTQPMSDTWVRLWLLPSNVVTKSISQASGVLLNDFHTENGTENGFSMQELASSSEKPAICGQGGLRAHWLSLSGNSFPTQGEKWMEHFQADPESVLSAENLKVQSLDIESVSNSASGKWVTASMLLFERLALPLTFVLGFNCGEIRLIKVKVFNDSLLEKETGGSVSEGRDEYTVQSLFKHTGPVICLAEHSIAIDSSSSNSGVTMERFLISGGMDCLTCIWDLQKGNQLLVVLHHHVTPVQEILLPSPGTDATWSNSFITVGEDGCVALISLETLRVERMFVGHPVRPKMIAWDGIRGYLSCLCSSISAQDMAIDVLFIWDLKSGALERVLRGAAAHSMFDNFLKQIQGSSVANNLLPGKATSISSLIHGDADSPNIQSLQSSSNDQFRGLVTKTDTEPLASGVPSDKHPGDSMMGSVEGASNKVIGSLEKLSSRLTQALTQGAKAIPSPLKESYGGGSSSQSSSYRNLFHKQPPVKGASPFPGIAALQFDLFTLMAPDLGHWGKNEREIEQSKVDSVKHARANNKANGKLDSSRNGTVNNKANGDVTEKGSKGSNRDNDLALQEGPLPAMSDKCELASSLGSFEGCLLRTSLAFLHLWGADVELDRCLQKELRVFQTMNVCAAAGFAGDRGATTLCLPGWRPTFELWTISPDFCALRSLTIVATALRMTTLSRLTSTASSALAAFYTRGLAEKFPRVKAPSLELYACFWQGPSEHVRMAARSLFHCAASRAIPSILRAKGYMNISQHENNHSEFGINNKNSLLGLEQQLVNECSAEKRTWPESVSISAEIIDWLDSFEGQSWTAIVGGTSQDARAGRIIVGAALAVWYPGLVRPELAPSVAPYLVKLVKAVIDRHSAVAAELLADGMESVWRHLIFMEIPQLISDIFLLIDCLSGGGSSGSSLVINPATALPIREALTGSLLPSLAMADISSFLRIVQTQLSVASADSSVHLVALMTIIRIIRGAPRAAVYYLTQVTSIILQTMNSGKHCFQSAMAAVREMVRLYPMVAMHQASAKLAVGDVVGDVHSLSIQVYDLNSASRLKVLDASGPPGHPALLASDNASVNIGGISALTFSEDGEGVVAFSQYGLMIRWWSLGAVWWERLSRVTAPVQCTKLVLVPPWGGFSPKSLRSSIMATISNNFEKYDMPEERASGQNVDLSFKLEWKSGRKISLLHHGQELGVFQL